MAAKLSKRVQLDYSNVLVAIYELMLKGGASAQQLLRTSARSVRRAEGRIRLGPGARSSEFEILGGVLDAWHRDRRYLNSHGAPRAVRLQGRAPSVEALIRSRPGRKDAPSVVRRLRALRLLVPTGRGLFKPASDAALISAQNPLVLRYVARTLSSLLETVGQNVVGAGTLPLIERVAEVPDLPREHVPAFREFTQTQGRTFVRTVNDWLESRRTRRALRRGVNGTVRAGIHTYAYVAPKRARKPSVPSRH